MLLASTVIRLVLAGVWLAAAPHKLFDLKASVRAVEAFEILPKRWAKLTGYAMPFLELAFGLLLLLGLFTRATAAVSVVFNLIFMSGIVSVAKRGLRIDCGCFSKGGPLPPRAPTKYTQDLIRDGIFVLVSVWLILYPLSYWALDNLR